MPVCSYLAGAGAGDCFDQIVADSEPQQVSIDVGIAALPGVMASDTDLLPGHAHNAVGADSAADPVLTGAVSAGEQVSPMGMPVARRR